MAIQYVDTNRQNTTFTPTNKQNLIDNIETVLLAAGWTTVSGHGTGNLLMQSAVTPQSLQGRVRFKDNSGTCVTISIENASGSVAGGNSTSAGIQLNPGSSTITYRIVANKYQAFIWSVSPTPARQYAGFGVPYIPSFLVGVATAVIWANGNAISDSDSTIRKSFRTALLTVEPFVGNASAQQMIYNTSILESYTAAPANSAGLLRLIANSEAIEAVTAYRWVDNSATLSDAILAWGLTSASDEGKLKAQLWDAMISSEAYAGDLTTSADSHNWIAVTDNNTGVTGHLVRGTLFIATP